MRVVRSLGCTGCSRVQVDQLGRGIDANLDELDLDNVVGREVADRGRRLLLLERETGQLSSTRVLLYREHFGAQLPAGPQPSQLLAAPQQTSGWLDTEMEGWL